MIKPTALFTCIYLTLNAFAAEAIDKELVTVTEQLAQAIKNAGGKKKVTVLDFADLQGRSSDLGKYIAEQLTVNFVTGKRDFAILDRANLKSILAEHKLTAQGLINPETAKKLGMFAGVDALIVGTLIPKKQVVSLTARVITTDTAEVVGAARGEFALDDTVQDLIAVVSPANQGVTPEGSDGPTVVRTAGDLRMEFAPLRIVHHQDYLLTVLLTNQSTRKSIWTTLNGERSNIKSVVINKSGAEFSPAWHGISGLRSGEFSPTPVLTEIKPQTGVVATIKFIAYEGAATAGPCTLNLELLLSDHYEQDAQQTEYPIQNIVVKLDAK